MVQLKKSQMIFFEENQMYILEKAKNFHLCKRKTEITGAELKAGFKECKEYIVCIKIISRGI